MHKFTCVLVLMTNFLTCMRHLRGAYAITWHPSSVASSLSSVSRARFVTAGAIDPKLCAYVPLGKSNSQTKFLSSLILGLATRVPKTENTKRAITPELMAGSSPNFYIGISNKGT
jgi:hypothetical protein